MGKPWENGGIGGIGGILWDFMGFYGILWDLYPLVNVYTRENHHAINGRTYNFYGNFQ